MELEEYLETMIPIIELVYKEKEQNFKKYKSTKLWFLYRHYFYGFEEFIDRKKMMYISEGAKKRYKELTDKEDLIIQEWKHQPKWDNRRQIFNYDHIFTGDMFRNSVDYLWSNNILNLQSLTKLIQNNYRIAWILKTEEKKIPKSKRGKTLKDAIKVYQSNGIILKR